MNFSKIEEIFYNTESNKMLKQFFSLSNYFKKNINFNRKISNFLEKIIYKQGLFSQVIFLDIQHLIH